MESASENARLIQDYLMGAKALEWNKYTLGEVGSRLWERLNSLTGQKETAEAEIKALDKKISDLEKRLQEAEKKPEPKAASKPFRRMEFSFMLRTYVVIAIVTALITMLSGWAGEKTNISFLQAPFELGTYFVDRFGFFLGVVIHYLLIPLAISVIVLLTAGLIRRSRKSGPDTSSPEPEPVQAEPAEEENALRKELELQIAGCREEIQRHKEQAAALEQLAALAQSDIETNDKVLLEADEALKKYYEINMLPEKYRGRVPVTYMEDLFGTGRCTALSGFDGALSVCDMEAGSAEDSPAVRKALEEATSNVEYLMDSLSKESQLPRYYRYSETLGSRVLEHMQAAGYTEALLS